MIYDCFMFYDETDLLDLRIAHHAPFVDRFALVESAYTYSGRWKGFKSGESRAFWKMLNDGRAYRIQLEFSQADRAAGWEFEHLQRDMLRGFGFRDDDVILYLDCDEIVRDRSVIERFVASGKAIQSLQMDLYFYYLNCRLKRGDVPGANYHVAPCFKSKWHMGKILRGTEWLRKVKHLYEIREHELWAAAPDMIERAGWHYSNLGSARRVFSKLTAISHFRDAEFANLTPEVLEHRMATLTDICGRPGVELEIVTDDIPAAAKGAQFNGYMWRP